MSCEFLKEKGECHFSNKECSKKEPKHCTYYKRQYPKNEEIFNKRFKKALTKALEKRDIYKESGLIVNSYVPDTKLSIFENIKRCLSKLDKPIIPKKVSRNLTKEDLKGNILKNITSNLFDEIPLKIVRKYDLSNSILVEEQAKQYIYCIKDPLDSFFSRLKKLKNKEEYLKEQTLKVVNL
jgi:hypothetical protein